MHTILLCIDIPLFNTDSQLHSQMHWLVCIPVPVFFQINWRPVLWGIVLQMVLGLLILRTEAGRETFSFLGKQVENFQSHVLAGVRFVFGDKYADFEFIFKVKYLHDTWPTTMMCISTFKLKQLLNSLDNQYSRQGKIKIKVITDLSYCLFCNPTSSIHVFCLFTFNCIVLSGYVMYLLYVCPLVFSVMILCTGFILNKFWIFESLFNPLRACEE